MFVLNIINESDIISKTKDFIPKALLKINCAFLVFLEIRSTIERFNPKSLNSINNRSRVIVSSYLAKSPIVMYLANTQTLIKPINDETILAVESPIKSFLILKFLHIC